MTTTLDHRPALPLTPLERPRPATGRTTSAPEPATPATTRQTGLAGANRNSDRKDQVALALSELFNARGDLDGVSLVADVLAEDLLWSA